MKITECIEVMVVVLVILVECQARSQERFTTDCKYKKGEWSECDTATNSQSRQLTLKRGHASCQQTKVVQRQCKSVCRYGRGEWSDCDPQTNIKSRNDTLKRSIGGQTCEPYRVITKQCKKRCRYMNDGPWSECDKETRQKTRMAKLKEGDAEQCTPTKVNSKPCRIKKKELCKYGPWSSWSQCKDGKKVKTRELMQGTEGKCSARTRKEKNCRGRGNKNIAKRVAH